MAVLKNPDAATDILIASALTDSAKLVAWQRKALVSLILKLFGFGAPKKHEYPMGSWKTVG